MKHMIKLTAPYRVAKALKLHTFSDGVWVPLKHNGRLTENLVIGTDSERILAHFPSDRYQPFTEPPIPKPKAKTKKGG